MVGAAEYEFASVGLFFSCGESGVLRRVLLAYALLHRYSNLPWWLDRLPPGHAVTTLQELADLWWGT